MFPPSNRAKQYLEMYLNYIPFTTVRNINENYTAHRLFFPHSYTNVNTFKYILYKTVLKKEQSNCWTIHLDFGE